MPVTQIRKTSCEFFAGIGLVDEALRGGDWQCIYANDIDSKKRAMYEGHYGASPHYHEGDVWNVEEVLERIAATPFLATASFPCTDMSLAGKRRGLAGEQSGSLFGFLQVIERLASPPQMVLLENVPGFLSSRQGRDFAVAVDALAGLGYWLDSFILDAQWFVPQSRQRLFLVGYHNAIVGAPLVVKQRDANLLTDPWRRAVDQSDRLRPGKLLSAIEAIQPSTGWATIHTGNPASKGYELIDYLDVDDAQPWWEQHEVDRHEAMLFDRHRREIEAIATKWSGPTVLTGFRRVRQGKQRLEVRFDGVAGCLRTPRGGSAKQIVLLVDNGRLRMRWMTPREYARLQGAPDYTLPDNTIQALFGFGDAVCVPAIAWIDQHMLTPVYDAALQRESTTARAGADGRSILAS